MNKDIKSENSDGAGCIFCKIVKGEIPCAKVYEDEDILAFLDVAPVNIGHSLVIPKEHFADIHETPDKIMGEMMKVAKKISSAIKSGVGADGINVYMNNDKAAFQAVFHAHVHVIPRFFNDGLPEFHSKRSYKEVEQKEVAKKIISAIP